MEYLEVISFLEGYLDNSFDTIAGYGKNGAIVHYVAEVALKRNIWQLEYESMLGLLSHPVSNFRYLSLSGAFFVRLSAQAANAATLGAIPGAVCAMSKSVASCGNQSQPRPGFLPFAGFRCAIRGWYHRCHSHPSCIPLCTTVYIYMVYRCLQFTKFILIVKGGATELWLWKTLACVWQCPLIIVLLLSTSSQLCIQERFISVQHPQLKNVS